MTGTEASANRAQKHREQLGRVLPILRCPADGGRLEASGLGQAAPLLEAKLTCLVCAGVYEYSGGVAFLTEEDWEGEIRQDVKAFYENCGWSRREGRYEDSIAHVAEASYLEPLRSARKQRAARHLKREGGFFLDVGCGAKPVAELSEGFDVHICVDFSLAALTECQRKLGDRGFYIYSDAARLPLLADSMDAVFSAHCVYHLEPTSQRRALGELHRVLRPGAAGLVLYGSPFSPSFVLGLRWVEHLLPGVWTLMRKLRHCLKRLRNRKWKPTKQRLYYRLMSPGFVRRALPKGAVHAELQALVYEPHLEAMLRLLPWKRFWVGALGGLERMGERTLAPFGHDVRLHFMKSEPAE